MQFKVDAMTFPKGRLEICSGSLRVRNPSTAFLIDSEPPQDSIGCMPCFVGTLLDQEFQPARLGSRQDKCHDESAKVKFNIFECAENHHFVSLISIIIDCFSQGHSLTISQSSKVLRAAKSTRSRNSSGFVMRKKDKTLLD